MNNKTKTIILGSLTAILMSFNTYGMHRSEAEGHFGEKLNYAETPPWGVGRGESLQNFLYQDIRNLGNVIPKVIEQRDFKSVVKNMFAIVHGLLEVAPMFRKKEGKYKVKPNPFFANDDRSNEEDEEDEEAAKAARAEISSSKARVEEVAEKEMAQGEAKRTRIGAVIIGGSKGESRVVEGVELDEAAEDLAMTENLLISPNSEAPVDEPEAAEKALPVEPEPVEVTSPLPAKVAPLDDASEGEISDDIEEVDSDEAAQVLLEGIAK